MHHRTQKTTPGSLTATNKNNQYDIKYGNRKLYLAGLEIDDENTHFSDYKIEEYWV